MSTPDPLQFSGLKLSRALLDNLKTLDYHSMTPIQASALPVILKGQDVIAQAKTGSGKTAAFGLGLLQRLQPQTAHIQALVLCPTRELADQVSTELRRLARGVPNIRLVSLCGGKAFGPQKTALANGAHIAVGTPGRILDHLSKGTLKLKAVKTLVLDEADRMLDMGFAEDMQQIIEKTPQSRQTLLFSATYPDSIQQLSRRIQKSAVDVKVDSRHDTEVIQQLFYEVAKHERNNTLLGLFQHYQPTSTIVFCRTKVQCDEVAEYLNHHHIQALAIHGDLEQRDRDRVLIQFANKSCPVLVATDVAARGLDIKSLAAVINYELPHDPEVYVHRIGRTGRAGEGGVAVSIVTPSDQTRMKNIEAFTEEPAICDVYASLELVPNFKLWANMTTIEINAGRKQKIRPGDLLGMLTGDADLTGSDVGKIDIQDMCSFVALANKAVNPALEYIETGTLKGRRVRARRLR